MSVDLKMEPKIDTELLVTSNEESIMSSKVSTSISDQLDKESNFKEQKAPLVSTSASASSPSFRSNSLQGNKTDCKREESFVDNPSSNEDEERRKSSAHIKDHPGKKKLKVDWTPELHGQFVRAVEQLGLDKAVPSKILELMGTDCLTRHNVASHLQKYRTQQKNLLAHEAEVATLRQRRRVYGATGGVAKRDVNSWVVPTTGFPRVNSMPHLTQPHVWGYPPAGQSWRYTWPDHRAYSPQPPAAWAPSHPLLPLRPGDHSSWYYYHQDVIASGMPCCPHYPSTTFASPTVPGIPTTCMYRVEPGIGIPTVPSGKTLTPPPFDSHLSNESIDAVIGDVLSKPWLPLPLGLKAPSVDGILMELQRQGISKIPPTYATQFIC